MATIIPKRGKRGITYQAQVRRKGHPDQFKTFKRLSDARRWAQRVETDIERGEFVSDRAAQRTLLSELALRYTNRWPMTDEHGEPLLNKDGSPVLGGNTEFEDLGERDRAKTVAKLSWWVEALGDPSLARLDGPMIREALDRLRAGGGPSRRPVKPGTANRYRAALRQALTYGVQRGTIKANPAAGPGWKNGAETQRTRHLDADERRRLLEAAERSTDRRLYPLVLLALASGGRQGELLSLRWSDLDVERSRVQYRGEETKNGEPRGVGVSPAVLAVLRERLVRHVRSDYVFADSNGVPRYPRAAWERALREAKIEDFVFHDCRHTFASALAKDGATLRELAEALGHRTLQMVLRYSHLTEGHTAEVTRRASAGLLS